MVTARSKRQRVSLTKLQRESAAGLELVSICQAATDDGILSDDEIADLRNWTTTYANAPLSAHAYLSRVIERVLDDGVITTDERREVYSAVERVLPPDLRSLVVARRRAAERLVVADDAPVEWWDFMVAGCRYDGRSAVIEMFADPGDTVYFVRDRDNPYSRNAIRCHLNGGYELGVVPEVDAKSLAPMLDAGHPYRAEIKKILTGGRVPIPVVVADVYEKESKVEGLTRASDAAARGSGMGCIVALAVLAAVGVGLWARLA